MTLPDDADNAGAGACPRALRTAADVSAVEVIEALQLLVADALAGGPSYSLPGALLIKGFGLSVFAAMEAREAEAA